MAGRKLNKIRNKHHPWDLKQCGYLVFINTENVILLDAMVFDTLCFTIYIMATRKIMLLTSVFSPTCVTSILTKLKSKLKVHLIQRCQKAPRETTPEKNLLSFLLAIKTICGTVQFRLVLNPSWQLKALFLKQVK